MDGDEDEDEEEPFLTYQEYRTGETFGTVAMALREEARLIFENEGRRMFITRHTILGRWHQMKVTNYAAYVRWYQEEQWRRGKGNGK